MQQELRLYFPLFQARQLVGGVSSAYRQEINKLRNFGISLFMPHLKRKQFRDYPYKVSFIFYTASESDMISAGVTAIFMIHLLESSTAVQSSDFRVVPEMQINIKKVKSIEEEGCSIIIEKIAKS